MKLIATVLLKVEPDKKGSVRIILRDQRWNHGVLSGPWDLAVKIYDSNLNCDVPENYALSQIIDELRTVPGVVDTNVCTIAPEEMSE